MGCVGVIKPTCFIIIISIHSSIHAPTWGATLKTIDNICIILEFQSTHPHGVRHNDRRDWTVWLKISIHAPTWGATTVTFGEPSCSRISIHAPTWGATGLIPALTRRDSNFNPRTHMGCDTLQPSGRGPRLLFQSTHPHGVRQIPNCYIRDRKEISIHAPTWGATEEYKSNSHKSRISIHAPTWGATAVDGYICGR